jgi:hypothetical protein
MKHIVDVMRTSAVVDRPLMEIVSGWGMGKRKARHQTRSPARERGMRTEMRRRCSYVLASSLWVSGLENEGAMEDYGRKDHPS